MKSIAIIDGANTYSATKMMGETIDYKRLKEWLEFVTGGPLRVSYHTAVHEDENGHIPMQKMLDWLAFNGYNMVTKPAKSYNNGNGIQIKGNMDVNIAVQMMEIAPHTDHIYLFTGDGDFCPAIEAVQRLGVYVTVISTTKTSPAIASEDIRRKADRFIDLCDIIDEIGVKL